MSFAYKSWVPSVTTRLSFSAIGNTNPEHFSRYIIANVADKETRYIICYQARNTLDALLPNWLATVLAGLSGRMWHLCIARTEPHNGEKLEKLCGHLFIFHGKAFWRGSTEHIVRNAQANLNKYRSTSTEFNLRDYFDGEYLEATKQLISLSSFHASFSLLRSGLVDIEFDPNSAKHKKAPTFPDNQNPAHMAHVVVSQCFFFLKDIVHHHKHHDPKTDTIIDIYRIDSGESWQREVLYSLYRKIIVYKKNPTKYNVFSSLGILAYAQAFKKIWERNSGDENSQGTSDIPYYNDEALKDSLSAVKSELIWRTENKISKSDKFRNIVISIIGIILGYASLIGISRESVDVSPDPTLMVVAKKMLLYPLESTGLVLFIMFSAFIYERIFILENGKLFRRIFRILQSFHIILSVIFVFIIASAFFLIAFSALLFI